MALGPVELLEVKFPGNQFTGEIVPALKALVESGTIRIIDIVFVRKDRDGRVTQVEISDLADDEYAALDPLVSEIDGLLSADDVQQLASGLENNSSAGIMLFENTWATRFVTAVRRAHGEVLLNERIPRSVIEQLLPQMQALQNMPDMQEPPPPAMEQEPSPLTM
jgi:uncharacterized membrane protein